MLLEIDFMKKYPREDIETSKVLAIPHTDITPSLFIDQPTSIFVFLGLNDIAIKE